MRQCDFLGLGAMLTSDDEMNILQKKQMNKTKEKKSQIKDGMKSRKDSDNRGTKNREREV